MSKTKQIMISLGVVEGLCRAGPPAKNESEQSESPVQSLRAAPFAWEPVLIPYRPWFQTRERTAAADGFVA